MSSLTITKNMALSAFTALENITPLAKIGSAVALIATAAIAYKRRPISDWCLAKAVVFENPTAAKIALALGADPNGREAIPLFRAFAGSDELARVFMDNGGNPNSNPGPVGRTLLHLACIEMDIPKIRLLLERGANVFAGDTNGQTPFHMLVRNHRNHPHFEEMAELLIDSYTDLDQTDDNGFNFLGALTPEQRRVLRDYKNNISAAELATVIEALVWGV